MYSSLYRYCLCTVSTSTAGSPAVADVKAAIDTLEFLWVDIITKNQSGTYLDAAYLIERNKHLIADQALRDTLGRFPLFSLSNTNERKCKRDVSFKHLRANEPKGNIVCRLLLEKKKHKQKQHHENQNT